MKTLGKMLCATQAASTFVITHAEFQEFLGRHQSVQCLVPESNELMRYSYFIVDEYLSTPLRMEARFDIDDVT